ncbi:MAG: glycerate kinase, partial [Coriobacteriia bacterium]|nr:glycerate kinase [Coriobacteriia bacterium]
HPMTSSTYGFGQLILYALGLGLRDFYLCIGGSATTDGGCGMAAALGIRFLDEQGSCFVPSGATLEQIAHIDMDDLDERVQASDFTVMCDTDIPLYGRGGAAYVYGPQKGADSAQVSLLDRGLRSMSDVFLRTFDSDYAFRHGAGAAGGLGFGCLAFLKARLVSGIDAILELCDFEKHLADTDLIITGEGKLDAQSFSGKALSGILRHANGVPVVSICGICDAPESLLRKHKLAVYETSEGVSIEESLENPEEYLRRAVDKALQRYFMLH